jgi:hypothetical protein
VSRFKQPLEVVVDKESRDVEGQGVVGPTLGAQGRVGGGSGCWKCVGLGDLW